MENPLAKVCVFLLNIHFLEGVPVVHLQENGLFSGRSFLERKIQVNEDLEDFTICSRISLNYLRGRHNYWFSIGNDTKSDLIFGVFNNSREGPRVLVRKFHQKILDEASIELDKYEFQAWHSYCFVFSSQAQFAYPGGYLNLTNKAYMDGKLFSSVDHRILKSSYITLGPSLKLLIGQNLANPKSKNEYSEENSFSGRFADFTIFQGTLDAEAVKDFANCRTVNDAKVIVEWNVNAYRGDEIDVEELTPDELCRSDPNQKKKFAIFNHGSTQSQIDIACEKLGGVLPTFGESFTDRTRIYNELSSEFESTVSNVTCRLSDNQNSDVVGERVAVDVSFNITIQDKQPNKGQIYFWTGITKQKGKGDDDKALFVNQYTNEVIPWDLNLWPGPVVGEGCIMARGPFLVEQNCASVIPCGICQIEFQKRLRLKGFCIDDLKDNSDFDVEYYAYGMMNGRIHFRGIRASHIFFDSTDGLWTLESFKTPGRISKLSEVQSKYGYPFGRLTWTVQSTNGERGICNLPAGSEHVLTFSDCSTLKFTCSNGKCISLESKCDSVVDCDDGSDEIDCEFLVLNKTYIKDKLPLATVSQGPVQVYFSIDITSFPQIDPSNQKLSSDYIINMRWYDPRLIFKDLNNNSDFNTLDDRQKQIIWSPKVNLLNGIGQNPTEVRSSDKLVMVREEGQFSTEDFSKTNEARLFSGEKNALSLSRKYSQEHMCNFNLFYYPFDTQACQLLFEIKDKSEDQLQLQKDGAGVSYMGSRFMSDYEVAIEELEIKQTELNHSKAVVTIVLRRQESETYLYMKLNNFNNRGCPDRNLRHLEIGMGFHIISTFVETLVIVLVAFVTFFFHMRSFTDRIMVNLVLLLILATINASVQSGAPKTSYYKMIDIWFLFLLILIVLTIIFHTAIAFLLGSYGGQKFQDGGVDQRRLFKRRSSGATEDGTSQNGSAGQRRRLAPNSAEMEYEEYSEDMDVAKKVNMIGMGTFLFILVVFNIIFWIIALKEHGTSVKDILVTVKDRVRVGITQLANKAKELKFD